MAAAQQVNVAPDHLLVNAPPLSSASPIRKPTSTATHQKLTATPMEVDAAHATHPASTTAAAPPPDITLRRFNLSDVDDLMTWASDPRATRYSRRGPLATREDALAYLRSHVVPHPWYRAICLENSPVGSISVKPVDGCPCRASLGYRLATAHWGRGIATAAVKKAAAEVFGEWPHLERVEAVADVENPASQRVLEKAGFKKEAVLRRYFLLKGVPRDVVMYSLVVPDDLPRPPPPTAAG